MAQEERPSTPEKQLLDLIEDPKEQDLSQKKIKRSSLSLFSFAVLKGRFSFFLDSIRSGSFFKKALFDVKGLSRTLKICTVLLFLYLMGNSIVAIMGLEEVPEFVARNPKTSTGAPATDFVSKKISDYLEGPRSRNIFTFDDVYRETVGESEEVEEITPLERLALSKEEILAKQLALVGIGWSDNPDVMIENSETKKMYFLKRGERIDGLIKVEAIFQNKVILTYGDGGEIELR